MSRQKTVFDTDDIARLWINGDIDYARNKRNNFWFRGDSIYSYSTEMARVVTCTRKGSPVYGHRVVLVGDDSYSVTTNKHQVHIGSSLAYRNHVDVPAAPWGGKILRDRQVDDGVGSRDRNRFRLHHDEKETIAWGRYAKARSDTTRSQHMASVRHALHCKAELEKYFPTGGTKRKMLTLNNTTEVNQEDNAEVENLLRELQRKGHHDYLSLSASQDIWQRMGTDMRKLAVDSKYAKWFLKPEDTSQALAGFGSPSLDTTFCIMLKKYPQELKTFLEFQALVKS